MQLNKSNHSFDFKKIIFAVEVSDCCISAHLNFCMTFLLITIFLLVPYIVLILFFRKSWLEINEFIPARKFNENELPFVSIIIAARNEEKNIGACIQSIIDQSYPPNKFEILVTDDHSTDGTVSIIQSFKKENIHVFHLADYLENRVLNSYKKKSIETALRFAKGEIIVTTDADCVAPKKWVETLVDFYKEKNAAFVALLVTFRNPLLNDSFLKKFFKIFQSLDFMTLQGTTGASVHKKFLNMCNGANLAYEKKAFYDVNGFDGIDRIASGDDMLLMHKIQQKYPDRIFFLKSKDIIVETKPVQTIKEFMNQRIRWASKTNKYTDKKIIAVLMLVYLLNAWIFILGISSFFFAKAFFLFLISIVIKIVVELFFLFPVAGFFDKKKLLWWFIPAQPFHILYTLIAGWLGIFGSYQWKGRKVK
jgi:cellulose synthase/poly-beta-1,6-N-acetylglucosamine synthase-like glycosyltransferase